jgi:hypothetical protein
MTTPVRGDNITVYGVSTCISILLVDIAAEKRVDVASPSQSGGAMGKGACYGME